MKPTISVITVTFNALDVLRCLMDILWALTHYDFKWIAVDSSLTDETVEQM